MKLATNLYSERWACPSIQGLVSCFVLIAILSGCSTLPKDFERTESHAFTDTIGTPLSRHRQDEMTAHPGRTGVLLLENGLDAFVARVVLAEKAERSIDAQYYLYHDDLTGRVFTYKLLEAADRGVRVRLLVDDMGLAGRDLGTAVLDHHPNIEVRLFNPFSRGSPRALQLATRFGKVTRRMHNKSFTVDNHVSVVGGRNIGDEYFDAAHEMNFSDLDALVVGPVVADVSSSFDQYWNSELSYPAHVLNRKPVKDEIVGEKRGELAGYVLAQADTDYAEALRSSELARLVRNDRVEFDWVNAQVVHDSPEKIESDSDAPEYHLAPGLKAHFDGVKDELIIISPYFVPGKAGTAFMRDLAARGVRVRVLTNSLASTDVAAVHAGYIKYRKKLLTAGIEIHESSPTPEATRGSGSGWSGSSSASLHTKSFVFDRRQVFIGSLNLDPRSIHENTEIGLVFDSTGIATKMVTWYDDFTENEAYRLELQDSRSGAGKIRWHEPGSGEPRIWTRDPESGLLLRFGVKLLRYLPIESQL